MYQAGAKGCVGERRLEDQPHQISFEFRVSSWWNSIQDQCSRGLRMIMEGWSEVNDFQKKKDVGSALIKKRFQLSPAAFAD